MGKLLSRQQAADYLGIDRQTVSNWLKSGILRNVSQSHVTLIDKNSLMKFRDSLKDLARMEENIRTAQEQAKKLWKETCDKLNDIRRAHALVHALGEDAVRADFLDMILTVALKNKVISQREERILSGFIHGTPVEILVEKDGTGYANVMLVARKAILKISEMNDYATIKESLAITREKASLADQIIKDQEEELSRLRVEIDKLSPASAHVTETDNDTDDEEVLRMRKLLQTRLVDLNLSTRCLVSLKWADNETLGDIVQYGKIDMLKLRNFGKKCLEEVEKLFNSYNLSFGMDITKYKKKGARLEYKSL